MEDFSPDVSKGLGDGQLVNSFRTCIDSGTARTIFPRILVWKSTRCISGEQFWRDDPFFLFSLSFSVTFAIDRSPFRDHKFRINPDINNSIVSFINATIQRGLKDKHCSLGATSRSRYVNSPKKNSAIIVKFYVDISSVE